MRPRRSGIVVVLAALALAGCQSPGSTTTSTPLPSSAAASCAELPARIVDAVQQYVDGFADAGAGAVAGAVTARQEEFAGVTADLRARGEELGCDPDELAAGIRRELDRLEGGTPVQDAVADTFRAGPLGTVDPSDLGAIQLSVGTAEELVAALAVAGTGSVIRLGAGEYRLTRPLVMLRPVTLVGAGTGSTTLASTAGIALVIATDGDAVVRDLALSGGGIGIQVAAGGYVLERLQISDVSQYGVVLRPAANPLLSAGTRSELGEVSVTDAGAGGVVVAGAEEPTLRGVSVEGSDGCGLCFVERSAGTVADAVLTDTQVGVRVDDGAAPVVGNVRVTGADVGIAFTGNGDPRVSDAVVTGGGTGIQVTGDGAGTVARTRLVDVLEVGVRVSGSARAAFDDLSAEGPTAVGVAVVGSAAPALTGGRIATTGDVGIIWAESGGGSATGVTIAGARLALQLSDGATPTVEDVTVESAVAGTLLANGRSAGRVTGLVCAGGAGGVVALAERTTVELAGSSGCEVIDERMEDDR